MKHNHWLLLLLLASGSLNSCFPDFQATEADRLYLRVTGSAKARVKWFTYSAAYADSPAFVTLETPGRLDTLCQTDNLEQVVVRGDTVRLAFNGGPRLYMEHIPVLRHVAGHTIVVDSMGQYSSPRPPRLYFTLQAHQ
jgi:hypothetical protein